MHNMCIFYVFDTSIYLNWLLDAVIIQALHL